MTHPQVLKYSLHITVGPEKQISAGPILGWALWYMSKGSPEILTVVSK